jgi:ribose transport system substrate-binding protein
LSTDVFVGRAKPPANTATARVYGILSVVLEVERSTGQIVDAEIIMHSQSVRRFLGALLVGRNLASDLPAITTEIEERFHSTSQRAVIQALYDAGKKYVDVLQVSQPHGGPVLRIADFSLGMSNAYLRAGMKAAKETATRLGVIVDVFDGGFDAATQVAQMAAALSSDVYNAFIVYPVDSAVTTPILVQAIDEKGIVVGAYNNPLGGRDLNEGDALCEPGTVTFVGGQTHRVYMEWMQRIVQMAEEAWPEGVVAGCITGPKAGANGKNVDDVLGKLLPGSSIELVANRETDYTTAAAYETAKDILRAHPDLRLIISNYSGMTQGIVTAVREAGLYDQVRICDFGGSQWALDAVRRSELEMTAIMLPYTETERAIEAVVDHAQGRDVPKFIDLTKHPSLPGTTFVTRANANSFTPQYN